jgi:hypothetical protein
VDDESDKKIFQHWKLTFIPRCSELYVYVDKRSENLSVFSVKKAIQLRDFLNEFIEANDE